jgi:hypothetical protein
MKSTEFLQAAIDVQAERGKQYDKPSGERSMAATVTAFNAITGRDLSESEGWLLLQTLKDVRQWQNPSKYHHDSALDGVAYSALKAEALSEENQFDPMSMPIIGLKTDIDMPSWDDAPEWAQWLAQDKYGQCWFKDKPDLHRSNDVYVAPEASVESSLKVIADAKKSTEPKLFPRPTSTAK